MKPLFARFIIAPLRALVIALPAFAALCLAFPAWAQLTSAQMSSLKALALGDPVATQYVASPSPENDTLLAEWFNVPTATIVWRSILPTDVMRAAIVSGAVQLDNLTVGKRDALLYLVAGELPNTAALRQALDDLCGTQTTLKDSIKSAERRAATRAEAALATGTGTTVSPATMSFEGRISQGEASLIRSQ